MDRLSNNCRSTVKIQTKIDGVFQTLGSGFLISELGHIVTCSHLFKNHYAKTYKVIFVMEDGSEYSCSANILDDMQTPCENEDITILRLNNCLPFQVTPLILKTVKNYDALAVQTFGYPLIDDFNGIHSSGYLIGDIIKENFYERIQSRFEEVEEGFSGAPVWIARTGEVIGMIYKIVNPNEKLRNLRTTFITPTSLIKEIYNKKHIKDKVRTVILQKDIYNFHWHIFAPFCILISFKEFYEKVKLFKEFSFNDCYYKIPIEKDIELIWFDFGIAVWHLYKPMETNRIFDFSIHRRKLYKELLNEKHKVCLITSEILNLIGINFNIPFNRLSKVGYALSFVDIHDFACENSFVSNALKLFSSPSVLFPTDIGLEDENGINPEKIDELENLEITYIKNGVPDKDHYSFEVKGITTGFASWSGVSTFIQDGALHNRTLLEFVEYELYIQSIWWYCSHFKRLAVDGDSDFVKSHFNINKLKGRFASLLSVLPRESAVQRLYKEAIIETSRIKTLYEDLKEWIL